MDRLEQLEKENRQLKEALSRAFDRIEQLRTGS
jgi:predicted nuclease with TOPRIM domain